MKRLVMVLPDTAVRLAVLAVLDQVRSIEIGDVPVRVPDVGALRLTEAQLVKDAMRIDKDLLAPKPGTFTPPDGTHRRMAAAEIDRTRPDDHERGPDKKPRQSPKGSVKRRLSFDGKTTEEVVIDALKNSPNQPASYLQLKQVLVKAGFRGTTISGVLQRLKARNKVVMPVNGYYQLPEWK